MPRGREWGRQARLGRAARGLVGGSLKEIAPLRAERGRGSEGGLLGGGESGAGDVPRLRGLKGQNCRPLPQPFTFLAGRR